MGGEEKDEWKERERKKKRTLRNEKGTSFSHRAM